ncbi:MAG: acetyl-CoA carboxylase biotin carboxyl carrier protein subunit [Proteobacteria bacterium]|nr:acetyl-CoA carboxylase biotin carboxyl carrier protein subunit [Pseudomonadota bacterium]
MDWIVNIGERAIKISLPDSMPDNIPFMATMNEKAVEVIWQRATRLLKYRDCTDQRSIWKSVHTRSKNVSRFAGEPDVGVSIEFTPSGRFSTTILEATVSMALHGVHSQNQGGAKKKIKSLRSQITGKVLKVFAKPSGKVEPGDVLLIIEAMKMENRILATSSAVVDAILVSEGSMVAVGAELIIFERNIQIEHRYVQARS